jgi:antitoxin component YwqK of YwqJK toxin-antitoxin module
MNRYFIFLLLAFCSLLMQAQDTLNVTDTKGRKQGFWRRVDTAGKTIYEGRFRDGVPEGEFRYFYPNGKLKTISKISNQGKRAEAVTYFLNGKKMAAGNYLDEKKDSTWQFFSESNGTLVSMDNYRAGVLEGKSQVFYPDGVLSEMIHYKNGARDGLWEQYYLDGKLKLSGAYQAGDKVGPFRTFHTSGQPMITGQYTQGHQDGTWVYFDDKGVITKKEFYNKGTLFKVEPPLK